MTNINFEFIEALEGNILKANVPDPENSNSGVTIGSGVDLGQKTYSDINRLCLSETLQAKLRPYLGKKRMEAYEFLKDNPLSLTTDETAELNSAVRQDFICSLVSNFDRETQFETLTEPQQTVIASVAFQYGNLKVKTPKFWYLVTHGNWEDVIQELRDFKDSYPTRRNKEADLLEASIT